jgi:hypothetical protein
MASELAFLELPWYIVSPLSSGLLMNGVRIAALHPTTWPVMFLRVETELRG